MRKILSLSKHGVLSIKRNRSLGIISANSAWGARPSRRPPYLALGTTTTTTTTLGQESAFSTSASYLRDSSAITGLSQQDEDLSKQLFSSNSEHGDSTIYALSTAPGRAAIAIIRITGPACLQIYRALCPRTRDPKPRLATVRALYEPTSAPSPSTLLDPGALVLYFPSPRTVTGEDVLELHVHGGPATVKAVLAALENCNKVLALDRKHDGVSPFAFSSIRYAEAGEFTRRAFMNDVLDLPQIEALGETLNAETEQQRRLAVRGASSNTLSARYEDWRQQLLYARGELEALIDFSEDQHFDESPQELIGSVAAQVRELRQRIQYHILNASKGELLRNGIKIALLGAPNAGKSSLLNRVVGKEAAIVSTEEGTTRDIVDVGIDLGGWYCKIGDMAGLRSAANGNSKIGAVELEGIRRAKHRALESDVVVVVLSLSDGMDGTTIPQLTVDPEVLEAVHSCQAHNKKIVIVINKADRLPASLPERRDLAADLMTQTRTLFKGVSSDQIFLISCKEAEQGSSLGLSSTDPGNIQKFLRGLIMAFEEIASPEGIRQDYDKYDSSYWEDSLGVTHRQQSNLQQCLEHLERFLFETGNSIQPQQHDANSNNNDQQKPEQIVLNNTSAYANLDVKFYTETQSDAHAFSGSDASKIQIQAQTPSDAVYNPNPQEWGANEKKQRKDNNSTYGNNRNNDNAATSSVEAQVDIDIVTAAENLRFAAESLAQITGRGGADVEDVLGVVFEKFCVGK